MFGGVEASAWMHVRNGTFKIRLLFGTKSDSVSVSLPTFFSDKRKFGRRKGEIKANKYQPALTSADE